MSPYVPILILMVLAVVIAGGMITVSRFLGPQKPDPKKLAPYECGMTPIGGARVRFSVKFYLIAMLFILFDIEVVFLYPVAIQLRAAGTFALIETIVFIVLLLIALVYVWRRGALEWR